MKSYSIRRCCDLALLAAIGLMASGSQTMLAADPLLL